MESPNWVIQTRDFRVPNNLNHFSPNNNSSGEYFNTVARKKQECGYFFSKFFGNCRNRLPKSGNYSVSMNTNTKAPPRQHGRDRA